MKTRLHSIAVIFVFLITLGSVQGQTLFTEDFSSGSLPAGWTNDSLGFPARHVWIFDNHFNRIITGAGFDSQFAIFDSDEGSSNDGVDEIGLLTTTDIDISTASNSLFLELDQQYRDLAGPFTSGSSMRISYSTDSGLTWNTIVYDSAALGYPNPAVHTVYDISSVIGVSNSIRIRFSYTGSWDWWWAIDNVRLISRQNCTTPPNAGTASASMTHVCPSDSFNLYLSGSDVGLGLSYQWQSSPDNNAWTDLTGDTLDLLRMGQATQTYFRCGVTCSGQTSYSASIDITMNPPTGCYCVPQFTSTCETLNKVQIGTLLNDNSGCNPNVYNYIQYPDTGNLTTDLEQGHPYSITITTGAGQSGNHGAAVWFDFNQNGSFLDLGEYLHFSDTIHSNSGNISRTIIIPPGAVQGQTRMRVRYIFGVNVVMTDDCTTYTFGETEDYTVNIIQPVNVRENALLTVTIYPSPSKNRVTLNLGELKGHVSITVSDVMGNEILKQTSDQEQTVQLNLTGLADGIYFVRLDHESGTITKKIIMSK